MSSRRRPSSSAASRLFDATWLLRAVFTRYRGPLPRHRPEVRAAYDRGAAARAAGRERAPVALEWDDLEAARAYGAGWHQRVSAPLPLPLELAGLAQEVIAGVAMDASATRRPSRFALGPLAVVTAATLARITRDAGERRAETLGLTPETAPRPAGSISLSFLIAFVVLGFNVRHRRRTGRWPRTRTPWERRVAAKAAAAVVSRRAWRRAAAA
jgi:hypothetical protein